MAFVHTTLHRELETWSAGHTHWGSTRQGEHRATLCSRPDTKQGWQLSLQPLRLAVIIKLSFRAALREWGTILLCLPDGASPTEPWDGGPLSRMCTGTGCVPDYALSRKGQQGEQSEGLFLPLRHLPCSSPLCSYACSPWGAQFQLL